MTRIDVLKAYNNVEACILVSQLSKSVKQEVSESLVLLRETALKAITQPDPKTATEISNQFKQADIIAYSDGLQLFSSLIPYLLRRQEAAKHYVDKGNPAGLEVVKEINKKISEILNLF